MGDLSLDQIQRKAVINTTLLKMMEEEELYWVKRSHSRWLHEGDNNTKFFHVVYNGRRRKNTITSFTGSDGVVEGDENLIKHATEYYKELFGPGQGNTFPLDPDMWEWYEMVTTLGNEELTQPFSEKEIKEALFEMETNKVVGPDCIQCWEIIKEDIIEMFKDFHEGRLKVEKINYGVITLLSKVVDAEKIQQYRPICLINCLYKWITKAMTIRMEKVADKLILQNQNAFMKSRNIMTRVMALHEILHETKKSHECGVILKLDFEKTYDKV
jgi:hypothetical protein